MELDAYETAAATAVKNACVSVTPALIDHFAAVLQPAPRDPPQDRPTCADWKPLSMPPDALDKLTPESDEREIMSLIGATRWAATCLELYGDPPPATIVLAQEMRLLNNGQNYSEPSESESRDGGVY